MCQTTNPNPKETCKKESLLPRQAPNNNDTNGKTVFPKRRPKREKQAQLNKERIRNNKRRQLQSKRQERNKKQNKQNQEDSSSAWMAILPSLGLLFVGAFAIMAKMGFRGRPTTAGIDLGTTNSVICVQSPSKSVGTIECIPDPFTNSPIIPSVVSFLDKSFKSSNYKKDSKTPSNIIVGEEAKRRIDSHPKSTFYHSKRVIGRPYDDPAIDELRHEVLFEIKKNNDDNTNNTMEKKNRKSNKKKSNGIEYPKSDILFHSAESGNKTPTQISSHVLTFLLDIASTFSSTYSSITSAVIAIPAEFTMDQRIATIQAFTEAGIKVARVLEEPTAAALAYGLDQKKGVEHILVYDFGGGTLDVSVLRVSPDGFVDVMASAGDSNLGGVDFDIKVADYLLSRESKHNLIAIGQMSEDEGNKMERILEQCSTLRHSHPCTETGIRTMAERMKIKLSQTYVVEEQTNTFVQEECLTLPISSYSTLLSVQDENDASICDSFDTHTIRLTCHEYDEAVSDLYPRSITPIRNVLKDLDMTTEDIDEVVMVGGTTRMPQIRNLVKVEFKGVVESLNTDIDPDLTVAYGAASVVD